MSGSKGGNKCVVRLDMPPNERPHMKGLNRYLTEYSEFWRSIGLKLGLESSVLSLIEADHRFQQRECFRATLQRWLQQDVQATWRKLELAITNAKREYHGYDTLDAMPSHSSVGSSENNVTVEPDTSIQCPRNKKCKKTQDHGATAGVKDSQPMDNDEGHTNDDAKKRKSSKYHLIATSSPVCAVVINNQTFDKASGLCQRKGSSEDVKRLQELKGYGLEFHQCPENCKAEEMEAVFNVIASSDDIQRHLPSATKSSNMSEALEKFEVNDKIKTTMECLTTEKCKTALETVTKNRGMKEAVLKILEKPLSAYHGLVVFIMTHGAEGGRLFGSDGKHITVEEIATLFDADNCPALIDKPKIFIIQACRGDRDDQGATKDGMANTTETKSVNCTNPSIGAVSDEADFLYVYSTAAHYAAYLHEDGSPFIQSLVEVFKEKLNDEHLEDALFVVKDKVASKSISSGGKGYKQIPSVISQMRDRVWFHK